MRVCSLVRKWRHRVAMPTLASPPQSLLQSPPRTFPYARAGSQSDSAAGPVGREREEVRATGRERYREYLAFVIASAYAPARTQVACAVGGSGATVVIRKKCKKNNELN